MSTSIVKTATLICEIDSQYPTSRSASSCDCGYYSSGPKVNNCFFHFDSLLDDIPAGSTINTATITVSQVSGGYSYSENIYITIRNADWTSASDALTWNSQGSDGGCGTISVNLSGSSAGSRTFTITSLIQALITNQLSYHVVKFARNPNTTSGTQDAKRFSTTAANHHMDITYTLSGGAKFYHYRRRRSGLWAAG